MSTATDFRLDRILRQTDAPVVIRLGKAHRLRVLLPFADDNRLWLQQGMKSRPVWLRSEKRWDLPANHFNVFVRRALERYGRLWVVQPYKEHEVCAPACWNAVGHECQCSCMGANHGSQSGEGFFVVNDTFAVRYGNEHVACRLMTLR